MIARGIRWPLVTVALVVASALAGPAAPANAEPTPTAPSTGTAQATADPGPPVATPSGTAAAPTGRPSGTGQLSARPGTVVPGSYLVVLTPAAAVDANSRRLTGRLGGRVMRTYRHAMRGFELSGTAETARKMAADPAVASVLPNHRFKVTETQTPTPSWGLDRVDQRSADLDNSYSYSGTAGNVRAYILDTGIRMTHQDFEGRAVDGFDAIDGGTADDCHGHGTHVAGTVGGSRHGVAKSVTLVAVRVLDCDGYGTTAQVVAGLDWVSADHAAGTPAVANMSMGGEVDQVIDDAVAASIADGITYAVSAGNDDADACTGSPARAPDALTVAATGGFFGESDERAYFSSYGPCVDLFAPGVEITSAYNADDTATESFSGTSMAAPHVAGAAALVLSEHPSYTPAQVRTALVADATPDVVEDPGPGSPNALLYVANVPLANDFSVAVTPSAGSLDPGSSITATVQTATTSGAAQPVRLSVSGLPATVSATFTPATVTSGDTSTLRLTATASAVLGGHPLKITGSGTSVSHAAAFQLGINGPAGCVVTSGQDLAILDYITIDSSIPIHGCAGAASPVSTVEVHIVHTFIGDLGVSLLAPDGTEYVLHDHTGSLSDNVDLTASLDLSSEVATGTWRLRIEDTSSGDVGYLDSWTLNLTGPPPTPGCTGSNPYDRLIPDPGVTTTAIVITGCARNAGAASAVTVQITHWFIGDLVVTLVAPDGSTYLLHDRTGGGSNDINQTYPVNLSSEPANGVWRLRVEDAASVGDGYLDSWSLTL